MNGRDVAEVATTIADLLADPEQAAKLGATGRDWMRRDWRWDHGATRLATMLGGACQLRLPVDQ